MLIRLAYEQGVLRRAALNLVQSWALEYYINMIRREHVDDEVAKLEMQCRDLGGHERWEALYGHKHLAEGEHNIDGQVWRPVTDPRDLDKWVDSLAAERGMTGAQAERIFNNGNHVVGYAEGTGRRV